MQHGLEKVKGNIFQSANVKSNGVAVGVKRRDCHLKKKKKKQQLFMVIKDGCASLKSYDTRIAIHKVLGEKVTYSERDFGIGGRYGSVGAA